jgi:prolyl oligopeptidase
MSNSNSKKQILNFGFFILTFLTISSCSKQVPPPPDTRRDDVVDNIHGTSIADPYRWLEDQNSPETRAWIDEQNKYTQSFLDKVPSKEAIRARYTELLRVDDITLPGQADEKFFFQKRDADQDLMVICMRKGLEGEDQVLIDPHGMSSDHTTSVNIVGYSDNGELLAYGIRKGGEDEVAIRIMDTEKKTELPDSLPRGYYFNLSFSSDLKGYYYSKFSEKGPRIYFHSMGTKLESDKLIFGESYGKDKIIYAELTDKGRYLIVYVNYGSSDRADIFIREEGYEKPFVPVVEGIDASFSPMEYNDELFIVTNWKAPRNRIMHVPINKLSAGPDQWTELIPEGEGIILNSSGITDGKLLIVTLENVRSKASFYDTKGVFQQELELPSLGTITGVSCKNDSKLLFYSFTSFHIPTTSYLRNMETGEQKLWSELNVPINQEEIEVKQVWFTSKDGTQIPMFLVYKKGLVLNGKNPAYITAYGGFNISETAGFSATAVIIAENGGVFALPNLRGGGEFGEEWHKAGMFEKKQNVFDDFYAAAEWLIENNYTNPDKIAIRGGSNGGLLVGAALTQRPELYKAIICTYPLLDMIRYHQFLVAKWWVPEYGSSEDPEQFKYILAYSPYQNVVKGKKYPATLFVTGDSDTRVDPLHARKMTALMQYSSDGSTPILLDYDTKAGHSGGGSLTKTIDDATTAMSFVAWQLDMKIKKIED